MVKYLGWDDYYLGHSTVRPLLPGTELGKDRNLDLDLPRSPSVIFDLDLIHSDLVK